MRLFIATSITVEVEKELARIISTLTNAGAPVKWVAPLNIHLTLKFLGDTNDDLIPQIKSIIDDTAVKQSPIASGLGPLGAFPNFNRARVIWVGLKSGKAELSNIAIDLDKAVYELGFARENRPFKAHLTLGRVKFPKALEKLAHTAQSLQVNPLQFKFDRIILFKSTLTPRGSIYEKLHQSNLT